MVPHHLFSIRNQRYKTRDAARLVLQCRRSRDQQPFLLVPGCSDTLLVDIQISSEAPAYLQLLNYLNKVAQVCLALGISTQYASFNFGKSLSLCTKTFSILASSTEVICFLTFHV
ncbi:hypothetical protein HanRHA438_Chr10g0467521 [Helianthus annuus]|nr:hypothetical protein HanRHA438_Chr10g0467521 [Helianthus annuus]